MRAKCVCVFFACFHVSSAFTGVNQRAINISAGIVEFDPTSLAISNLPATDPREAKPEKEISAAELQAAKDAQERAAKLRESVISKVHPQMLRLCNYDHDLDENGAVYYLATGGLKEPWKNPVERGTMALLSSGVLQDGKFGSVLEKSLLGREVCRCVTQSLENGVYNSFVHHRRFGFE